MAERHEAFENGGASTDRIPRHRDVGGRGDAHLALAVIAHAQRLEDRGRTDLRNRRLQFGERFDLGPGRGASANVADQGFFDRSILRDAKCGGGGVDGHLARQIFDRIERDILELVGDHIGGSCKFIEHDAAVIIGASEAGRGLRRHCFLIGREDARVIAKLRRRHREHPSKLAAAEDADGRSGGKGGHAGPSAW